MPDHPSAVLLDVGGVFLLPSRQMISEALARIGHQVPTSSLIDRAHYLGVRVFPMDLDPGEWMGPYWNDYLDTYARSLDVPGDLVEDAVEHLRNQYMTGELWRHVIDGSKQGLADLVDTGVPVGIVSNSDGTVEARLAEDEVLQVGPGPGVEVRCVVDSGKVGVEKPDPRIFDYALETLDMPPDGIWYLGDTPAFDVVSARRAGMTPILIDPFGVNGDFGVPTVRSVGGLVDLIGSQLS